MNNYSKVVTTLSKRHGFTIVELLIVIVVISILAAITLVAYNGITNRAKDSAALSNATQAGKKLTVYALSNNDTLPPDLATAGLTNSPDTTYQYTLNTASTPDTFCVTTTSSSISAHSAGTTTSVNNPTPGPCAGHTGTAPTTLADGSSCPTGYIVVPGSSLYGTEAFCTMKYEAKNVSGVATSQAAGTPWVSIIQTAAISTAAAACAGCHLITEAEWLTIAQNVLSVPSNWSGGTVGSGFIYSGHNDNVPANSLVADTNDTNGYGTGIVGGDTGQATGSNQRRTLTLTNGEVIWDFAGNVSEWTQGTLAAGQLPGLSGDAAFNWRQWNNTSLIWNGFPESAKPWYGSPASAPTNSNWGSTQGIGQLYTNSADTLARAFRRGGAYSYGTGAGILALALNIAPSNSGSNIGFRVAR